jgi:membrane-associated phospholipid phosphatase
MSDAGVASWDAKFAYWDPRPENGVRDAGVDPEWEPYIETPFFPSYVSGHATYSGAAASVLGYLSPTTSPTSMPKPWRPPTPGCGEGSTGERTTRLVWTWGARWATWWWNGLGVAAPDAGEGRSW